MYQEPENIPILIHFIINFIYIILVDDACQNQQYWIGIGSYTKM
jgi:hypothetical protein